MGASIILALAFRSWVAVAGDYGPADLQRFEVKSGINLPDWYGRQPFLLTWSRGDGQIFLSLAADPLLNAEANRITSLDYRLQRIGYSLAGKAAVLGRFALLPIGLLAINVISVGLIAAVTARLAASERRYWWLLANPAILIGLAGDTAEPFGIALLLGGMVGGVVSTQVFAALLGIVRPDFGFGFALAQERLRAVGAWLLAAFGLAVSIVIAGRAGQWGTFALAAPLAGYIEAWSDQDLAERFVLSVAILVGVATIGYSCLLRGFPRVAFLLEGLLMLSYAEPVLRNVSNLVRVSGALPVLWVFGILERQRFNR